MTVAGAGVLWLLSQPLPWPDWLDRETPETASSWEIEIGVGVAAVLIGLVWVFVAAWIARRSERQPPGSQRSVTPS